MADPPLTVTVTDNTSRHRYEAHLGGDMAAFATYELTPTGITFLHTETEHRFEGHGVASRLAQSALDDVRARGLRVTAQCPFIASYIDSHPAYADLLDPAS